MRSSWKLVVAIVATTATMLGGSAFASGHGGGTQASQLCGTGSATVGTDAPMTMWPPNHSQHTYTFTYSGGTSGDTFSTTTTSSDGNGVVAADTGSPATADDTGTASTQSTLVSARPGTSKTGRTYTVSYDVQGSNTCSGSFTITVPHDRRKAR